MALHAGLSFCKTQQVVGFDCAGIERLSVPQPNSPALSQARRGPTHPVTVMFYTPRGRAAISSDSGNYGIQKIIFSF